MDESSRCEQVGMALQEASSSTGGSKTDSIRAQVAQKILNKGVDNNTSEGAGKTDDLRQWYEEYCGSCRVDHDALLRQREGMSMASL